MLEFIRQEIRDRAAFSLPRFEAQINGKTDADAYQEAMRWLGINAGQDAVNEVVKRAVLKARRPSVSATFVMDGDPSEWHLPTGTISLGDLVARGGSHFLGPILTTNFDPLISLAIRKAGGRASRRVITADGTLAGAAEDELDVRTVVHLHGYWRDSDTLHTQAQLTNDRPKLKASLQRLLRQRTLIVAAYGGWDDVFTKALVELMNDEHAPLDVIWCFHEVDSAQAELRHGKLLAAVAPAILINRFRAFGGVDCHTLFAAIGGLSPTAPAATAVSASPLAGWERIDSAYLSALTPLRIHEVIKYFDGAIPTWRHAASSAIPRRQAVFEASSRLTTLRPGQGCCSLQLIRAAGGEGKTTLLLQTASHAAGNADLRVLWRPSPYVGLPPEHVINLDTSKEWLIVADDADTLVRDLSASARVLHEAGRSNVHFLLAARDADWWNAKGDRQPWEEWLIRDPDVILRGLSHADAEAVVQAWGRYGRDGLRELATLGTSDSQVAALEQAIRDATNEELRQNQQRTSRDGSFFGGLLAARFGQDGLRAHVRAFLDHLKEVDIDAGNGNLLDALAYVAACHGTGISGIDENVLADLLSVSRDWVQGLVVRPLGEEAAAVHSAGHVFTRHSKVAAAILVEAEQGLGLDLAEAWKRLVRQTVRTGRDIRMDRTWFSQVVHAGPRLQGALPPQLSEDRRKTIAIAAASASSEAEPDRLSSLVDLGRTYRNAGMISEAVATFRNHLDGNDKWVDYNSTIRGYWYEWGVCEGLAGHGAAHRAADAWVQGLSLSDHLNPASISDQQVKLSCAGLGVAFGKLAQAGRDSAFAKARRAVAYIGRLSNPDSKAMRYFDRYDREADKLKTLHPNDMSEAIAWLTGGVAAAGAQVRDPLLARLADAPDISFALLETALKKQKARGFKSGG
jgi:hypothetical protein